MVQVGRECLTGHVCIQPNDASFEETVRVTLGDRSKHDTLVFDIIPVGLPKAYRSAVQLMDLCERIVKSKAILQWNTLAAEDGPRLTNDHEQRQQQQHDDRLER